MLRQLLVRAKNLKGKVYIFCHVTYKTGENFEKPLYILKVNNFALKIMLLKSLIDWLGFRGKKYWFLI